MFEMFAVAFVSFFSGIVVFAAYKKEFPDSKPAISKDWESYSSSKCENDSLYYDPVSNELFSCNSVDRSNGKEAAYSYREGYFAYDLDEDWRVCNVREVSEYTEYIGSL